MIVRTDLIITTLYIFLKSSLLMFPIFRFFFKNFLERYGAQNIWQYICFLLLVRNFENIQGHNKNKQKQILIFQ